VPTFFVWPAFHISTEIASGGRGPFASQQGLIHQQPAVKGPDGWGLDMKASGLTRKQPLTVRITELAEQVADSMGMEIVLVEIKGSGDRSIVRTFIDQPGGITLDDCERFSKHFSVSLDVEDWIPFSYTLEVSSPGINRPLVKETDFQRFCGKQATVRSRKPIDGQKNFKGSIENVADGRIEIKMAGGKTVTIALMDIEKANLIGDLNLRP
jgi:ribosome maturation factor RimP